MKDRPATLLALTLAAVMLLAAAPALALAPSGDAQQINVSSPYWQVDPATAVSTGNGFLVLWEDMRFGISGRFVDAAGSPVGGEMNLVANTPFPERAAHIPYVGHQDAAAVGLDDGGFLLLWTRLEGELTFSWFHSDFDASSHQVFAQRFTAAGAPAGDAVLLADSARRPGVALLSDGRAAVAWEALSAGTEASHVAGRVLDLDAGTAGPAFQVSTDLAIAEPRPVVAAGRNGGFVVAWTGVDASDRGIYARSYDGSAVAIAAPVRVNQLQQGGQVDVSAAVADNGRYLLAWQHAVGGKEYRIQGRFLNAQGAPAGPERTLSVAVSEAESAATLAPMPGGGYYLFYLGWHYGLPQWVVGVELNAAAAAVGDPFQVSTERPRPQYDMGLAVGSQGAMVVWESRDGSGYGVTGRTFQVPTAAAKSTAVLGVSLGQ